MTSLSNSSQSTRPTGPELWGELLVLSRFHLLLRGYKWNFYPLFLKFCCGNCAYCNFYFKESYNHKLLRIFKGDNLRSLLTPGHFFTKYKFSSFFVNRYFALLIMI